MRRWWLWIALLLSVGVNVGVLLTLGTLRARVAEPAWRPAQQLGPRPNLQRFAEILELEGEVQTEFVQVHRNFVRDLRRRQLRVLRLRREMRREMRAEVPDRQVLDRILGMVAEETAAMERSLVDTILETRKILPREREQAYVRMLNRLRHQRPDLRQRPGLRPRPGLGQRPDSGQRPNGRQRNGRRPAEPDSDPDTHSEP